MFRYKLKSIVNITYSKEQFLQNINTQFIEVSGKLWKRSPIGDNVFIYYNLNNQ